MSLGRVIHLEPEALLILPRGMYRECKQRTTWYVFSCCMTNVIVSSQDEKVN